MARTIPEVDAYIANAPEYARPILAKLRRLFHRASPKIGEAIKWGNPAFVHEGIVGGMGAFKHHVSYGFWRAREMADPAGLFPRGGKASPFAIRAATVRDLPPDAVLIAYIREAVRLNEAGGKARGAGAGGKPRRPAPKTPPDLAAALARSKRARATFEAFPPSRQREYVEWIEEAKRDATRQRRLAQAIEWLAEGKARNWKYEKR